MENQSEKVKNTLIVFLGSIFCFGLIGVIIYSVIYLANNTPTVRELPKNMSKENDLKNENQTTGQVVVSQAEENAKVEYAILKQGAGTPAKNEDKVTVHYVGVLLNGTKFDSSIDRGEPFQFTLGAGQVIAGWEMGVIGMMVGERRRLVIPPKFGYGEQGTPGGPIPPNATLVFEIELLKIN